MTPSDRYEIQCNCCGAEFDALAARWCNCGREIRSLVCTRCNNCFCSAPAPYRRRFWERAPRALRESPQRFRQVMLMSGPEGEATDERPTVLVIDDDEAMRSLVACYVEQLGYRVMTAGDGHEGLSMAMLLPVDVIITDALMPRLDGREIGRLVKEAYGDARKVIVMTSLYRHERHRTEAHRTFGIDEYLTKPFDFNQLARTLERFASRAPAMSARQTAVHYPDTVPECVSAE